MDGNKKSKMTVIILFILMIISIILLVIFIFIAANNLEERQNGVSEAQPVTEEYVSVNEISYDYRNTAVSFNDMAVFFCQESISQVNAAEG